MIFGHFTTSYVGLKVFKVEDNWAKVAVIIGSYSPDFIDKPLYLLFELNGRGIGHSFIALSILATLRAIISKTPLPERLIKVFTFFCIGHCLHLIGDLISLQVFLFPFLGYPPIHKWTILQIINNHYSDISNPLVIMEIISLPPFLYYFTKDAIASLKKIPLPKRKVSPH